MWLQLGHDPYPVQSTQTDVFSLLLLLLLLLPMCCMQANLAMRVKMVTGQRVCAFGFNESEGPAAGWMLDGWLEGPNMYGAGMDHDALTEMLLQMQSMQKFQGAPANKGFAGTCWGR